MIVVPLLDVDPATGKPIDYGELSQGDRDRTSATKFETADGKYKVHVIGFAKIIGELLDGVLQVMMYFGDRVPDRGRAAVFDYTRCWRSTSLVLFCSLIAVIWQIGILHLIGIGPDAVLGAGAVPDLRDRRVARRAEDERHHAGRRARHASPWSPRATRSGGSSSPA